MKFLHIADVHLGYEQYGCKERFDDFSRAYLWLIDYAIEQKVDFVILSGDLFHKRAVDPLAMRVAVTGAQSLEDQHIPIYAVEGNHEKAYFSGQRSWMDVFGDQGNVILLDGECTEYHGATICGMRYVGAETDDAVKTFFRKASDMDFPAIMMLHAGLEGQISHVGRLSNATVNLSPFDYLALGHIHKPYITGHVYNPGSPENVSAAEVLWPERGGLLVDADDDGLSATMIVPPRRPFHRFDISLDGATSPDILLDAAEFLFTQIHDEEPVVDISLTGEIQFGRSDLDIKGAKEIITQTVAPLVVHIRNETVPAGFSFTVDATQSKPDIERNILERVIKRNAAYRDDADKWTSAAATIKDLALTSTAEDVVDYLGGLCED